MDKVLSAEDYITAARLVATCSEHRLPYVLEIIRQSGIDLSALDVEVAKIVKDERKKKYSRKTYCKKVTKFAETEDELVIRLKKAYTDKVSFSALGKASGVNRSTLYKYVWGERKIPDEYREQINSALDRIYEDGGFDD